MVMDAAVKDDAAIVLKILFCTYVQLCFLPFYHSPSWLSSLLQIFNPRAWTLPRRHSP